MALIDGAVTRLPEAVRRTLRAYLAEISKHFGQDLEAVILYGSAARGEYLPGRSNLNVLIVLKKLDAAHLQDYVTIHRRWKNEGIVVPLFLTLGELQASVGVFSLEYLDIQEQHVLLAGRDPFADLKVDEGPLRWQCEQELNGNLVRLRQRYVEGGGDTEAAVILLSLSVTALMPCLRALLRLTGRPVPKVSEEVLDGLHTALSVETAAFLDALRVKRGLISPGPLEIPRLFERYLSGLQSLIERVGALKREGRL